MTLSIIKLEQFLSSKGFIITNIFTINKMCVYFETMNITSASMFIVYVPSKYQINIDTNDNVYKMKYIDIKSDGSIPGEYASELDDFEMERNYEEIDINVDYTQNSRNVTAQLEENYNYPVTLKNISRKDKDTIKDTFRQLKRLKFCVQSIKYKLCITFKNFFCCIRRDNTLECYFVKYLNKTKRRKLMICLDLESLYAKCDSITTDMKIINTSIYKILDKNQDKHVRNLQKMFEYNTNITAISDTIHDIKSKYTDYLTRLETMLEKLNKAEKKNVKKIMDVEEKYGKNNYKGLHTDIEKTHLINKYETNISHIHDTKQELIKNISSVKEAYENVSLKVDKICFDNIVMVDTIIKNLRILSKIINN